jgi:hypothetical protein
MFIVRIGLNESGTFPLQDLCKGVPDSGSSPDADGTEAEMHQAVSGDDLIRAAFAKGGTPARRADCRWFARVCYHCIKWTYTMMIHNA